MYGYGKFPKNLGGLEPAGSIGAEGSGGAGVSERRGGREGERAERRRRAIARNLVDRSIVDRSSIARAIPADDDDDDDDDDGRGTTARGRTVLGRGDLEGLLVRPFLLRSRLELEQGVAARGRHRRGEEDDARTDDAIGGEEEVFALARGATTTLARWYAREDEGWTLRRRATTVTSSRSRGAWGAPCARASE
jgi:hypothetical protein